MALEIPFSITLRGRKADRNLPQRALLDAVTAIQDETLDHFNDISLEDAGLSEFIHSLNYSVVVDKPRRVWAELGRAPFRIQMFLKWQFEDPADIQRISEHTNEFFSLLYEVIEYDAGELWEELETLQDPAIVDLDHQPRTEIHVPDPWLETYKGNIKARTAERTLAKLNRLPENVIRKIGSYVGTRRKESAPRLRPLPAALRNSAIREAGIRRPEKAPAELRAASPVPARNETRKNSKSWLKRLFTRRKRNE
jgi:hypothetical protein